MFASRLSKSAVLFALCLAYPAFAQKKIAEPGVDTAKHAKPAKTAAKAAVSYSNWEVYRNITIPAGESVSLDSGIDFSSADQVGVTVRSVSGGDLTDLLVQGYWSVPEADFYNVAEVISGSSFPYLNVGGASFHVYGSQFRLIVRNDGISDITLQQITVFCHSM